MGIVLVNFTDKNWKQWGKHWNYWCKKPEFPFSCKQKVAWLHGIVGNYRI